MIQRDSPITVLKEQGFPSCAFLYSWEGISKIDEAFLEYLKHGDLDLHTLLSTSRKTRTAFEDKPLMDLSRFIEAFLIELFDLQEHTLSLSQTIQGFDPLLRARTVFVQRFVLRDPSLDAQRQAIHEEEGEVLKKALYSLLGTLQFEPTIFAQKVLEWLENKEKFSKELEAAQKYTLWRLFTPLGQAEPGSEGLFDSALPKKYDNLLKNKVVASTGEISVETAIPLKTGFAYRGSEGSLPLAVGQMKYCLFCHPQKKDSCSHGLRLSDGSVSRNPLQRPLEGCPLRQKISQMNKVASEGFLIGALAIITLDNPLVAATGAHICNDCKEACIFQKQEGVDVPRIETQILKEVMALPFGFEIYSLLTRWRPLCAHHPIPSKENGFKVLVVGMGPAGCMASHLLVNQGYTVVGVDGLKAVPLGEEWVGNNGVGFSLIKDSSVLFPKTAHRMGRGFGGVLDYGITARWDKRFLSVIRLLLERRAPQFTFLPNVRFGDAFDERKAQSLGFDHVCLCLGAGAPKRLGIKKDLIKGVWLASDFLMGLHRAAESKTSLMVPGFIRLPCVVVGGGLTAVDAATEVIHGYIEQIDTFLERYEGLLCVRSQEDIRARWTEENCQDADTLLSHGRALSKARTLASKEGKVPDYRGLIKAWGGVHLLYRNALTTSPAYRTNSEELQKSLEAGVQFHENATVAHVYQDNFGGLEGLGVYKNQKGDKQTDLLTFFKAKMAIVAYGTDPNTVLMRENESVWTLSDVTAFERKSTFVFPKKTDTISTSLLGDMHPKYAGSVVKAMASAKDALEEIIHSMAPEPRLAQRKAEDFSKSIQRYFKSFVKEVNLLGKGILELVVEAPFAAESFKPGQFFRLSNQYPLAPKTSPMLFNRVPHTWEMEGIALTGCHSNAKAGTLSMVVLEEGVSTSLIKSLKGGDEVSLMGPTGKATSIPQDKNVLLVGGGLGTAVLFSLADAMKKNGCHVHIVSGYKSPEVCFKRNFLERVSDRIVWCFETNRHDFIPKAPDLVIEGTVLEGIKNMMDDSEGKNFLRKLDTFMVIGSASMMAAAQKLFDKNLKGYLPRGCKATASINAPMNCMLKEICGKCIQRQYDSSTGIETFVFSCTNQDQPLQNVDFAFLKDRLSQNHLLENLTFQWKQYLEGSFS